MLLRNGTDQLLTLSERYQIEFAVQYMFHRSITIHKSESSCNMIVCQSSIELGLSVRSVWNKAQAQAQARSLDLISLYLISQVVDEEARRTTWTSFWFELSRVELIRDLYSSARRNESCSTRLLGISLKSPKIISLQDLFALDNEQFSNDHRTLRGLESMQITNGRSIRVELGPGISPIFTPTTSSLLQLGVMQKQILVLTLQDWLEIANWILDIPRKLAVH